MPTIVTQGGLRVVVHSNDHGPPHVHVKGKGWEIRIRIDQEPEMYRKPAFGAPSFREVNEALALVDAHLILLREAWEKHHGPVL